MKWKLVAVNIAFLLLMTTFIYSVANVDIEVSYTRAHYSLKENNITASIPVTIKNEGFYPIQNVRIKIGLKNDTTDVWNEDFIIKEIHPFEALTKSFVISINLISLYKRLGNRFIFSGGYLKTIIVVSAQYWILAKVDVNYTKTSWWKPFIEDFRVDTGNITFKNGTILLSYILKSGYSIKGYISGKIIQSGKVIASGKCPVLENTPSLIKLYMTVDPHTLNGGIWKIVMEIHLGNLTITTHAFFNFDPMDIKNLDW